MSTLSFDGTAKKIYVTFGPSEADTSVAVIDMYSAWKDWAISSNNLKYTQAMYSVGGEPLGGVERLGQAFFLLNGWTIAPDPTQTISSLTLDGNLFPEPEANPIWSFSSLTGGQALSVDMRTSTLPVLLVTGGGTLTTGGIADAVWQKNVSGFTVAGQAGTELNAAADPWGAQMADHSSAGSFGAYMKKLLTLGKFLGLK